MVYWKQKSAVHDATFLAALPDGCRLEPENYPIPPEVITEGEFHSTRKRSAGAVILDGNQYKLYTVG